MASAQKNGELRDDLDLDVVIDVLWGPILNRWLQRSGPLSAQYVDALVDTALEGMRPRAVAG